jgi:hypothetical protein
MNSDLDQGFTFGEVAIMSGLLGAILLTLSTAVVGVRRLLTTSSDEADEIVTETSERPA